MVQFNYYKIQKNRISSESWVGLVHVLAYKTYISLQVAPVSTRYIASSFNKTHTFLENDEMVVIVFIYQFAVFARRFANTKSTHKY